MIVTIGKSLLIGIMLCISLSLAAQLPISWSQNLGDNQKNIIQDVIDLDGQGCLTIGYTQNAGNSDLWINRVSNTGTTVWSSNFGGTCFEKANAAALLDDGTIVLVGHGSFSDGNTVGASKRADGVIVKIDAAGNIIWQRTYGGLGYDAFEAVVAIPNGQCLAVGATSSFVNNFDARETDGWAVRINSNGSTVWNQTYGGSLMDRYTTVLRKDDGSFLLGGTSNSRDGDSPSTFGGEDMWITKITSSGVHDWSSNYGGTGTDEINAITESADGNYVLAGTSYSPLAGANGHGDAVIMKVTTTGSQLWQRNFGGSATEKSTDIHTFEETDFLFVSTTYSDDGDIQNTIGNQDAWLTKLNSNGNIVWQQTLGGSQNDAINAMSISPNGSVWMSGYSFSSDNDLSANSGAQDGWLIRSNVDDDISILNLGGNRDICIGAEITLDATDPNCGSCTYLWNDGVITPTRVIQVTSSATYSVTITDSGGMMSSDSIDITAINPISATAQITPVTCNNADDGSILLNTIGGDGDYTFQWSNTPASTPNNSDIASGTYFVTISDDALCEFTDSYTLDNPSPIDVTFDIEEPSCNGTDKGSVSISISGGEPPYSIGWSTGSNDTEITGLDPGQYDLTITDARDCIYTQSFFLSNEANIQVEETIQHISCNGLNDGQISLSVSGDFPPFSFMWDNGFSSNTIVGLSAGTHTVTITDAMDCQLITQYTITEPNELQIFEEQTNTQAGQSVGRLVLNISGGTPTYAVQWSNGETGFVIDELGAGFYTATVTDANGCEVVKTFEIQIGTATTQVINTPLELYPNPNQGTFTVNLPETIQGDMKVSLLSIAGQEVHMGIHNHSISQMTVITRNLAPGMYLLSIQDDSHLYQSKVIIHQ